MTLMAIIRCLHFAVLRALTPRHKRHAVSLAGDLPNLDELIRRDFFNAPQHFALGCLDHAVANLQKIGMSVYPCPAHRKLIWLTDLRGPGFRIRRAVACLTLDVLHVLFGSVDMSIAHCLLAGMAIDAIQFIFAAGEFADRLVILNQPASFGLDLR